MNIIAEKSHPRKEKNDLFSNFFLFLRKNRSGLTRQQNPPGNSKALILFINFDVAVSIQRKTALYFYNRFDKPNSADPAEFFRQGLLVITRRLLRDAFALGVGEIGQKRPLLKPPLPLAHGVA